MYTNKQLNFIKYIVLYHIVCGISIAMCYIDAFITHINCTLQDFLIDFFMFLSWIVLVTGAIRTFPQDKFSNKRIWYYVAIMGGSLSIIDSFIGLINILTE